MIHSFIRDSFDLSAISDKILSIQVSQDGFSFVIQSPEEVRAPDFIYIRNNPDPISGNLLTVLKEFTDLDLKEFYNIRILMHETRFALVPEEIFDLQDTKAYLKVNYPHESEGKSISNAIPGAGAVCVFIMNEALYKLLKTKFPGADFCHTSLPFCSMAGNISGDSCCIQVYGKTMEVAAFSDKKLLLYNIFNLQNGNDIVYHVLNTYRTIKANPDQVPLIISGLLKENSEIHYLAARYIKNISFYKAEGFRNTGIPEDDIPPHYFINHKEVLHCEL
jgi:hypothetical protein